MNIVCCIDRNYVMPAGVLITSICINNPDAQIAFHIVCNPNVTRQDKDDLTQIVEKYGNKILFYGVDEQMLSSFTVGKAGQPGHITIATYYRLLLPLILPEKSGTLSPFSPTGSNSSSPMNLIMDGMKKNMKRMRNFL